MKKLVALTLCVMMLLVSVSALADIVICQNKVEITEAMQEYAKLYTEKTGVDVKVITGGARGIDALAFQAAEAAGIRNLQILPDRKKFPGKMVLKAFLERNKQIVERCDVLLAVWDGKSRGTMNTLAYARKVNKPVFLIEVAD